MWCIRTTQPFKLQQSIATRRCCDWCWQSIIVEVLPIIDHCRQFRTYSCWGWIVCEWRYAGMIQSCGGIHNGAGMMATYCLQEEWIVMGLKPWMNSPETSRRKSTSKCEVRSCCDRSIAWSEQTETVMEQESLRRGKSSVTVRCKSHCLCSERTVINRKSSVDVTGKPLWL